MNIKGLNTRYFPWLIAISFLCINLLACSTKTNTPSSRAYHQLTTRFNIYYKALNDYENILEEQHSKTTETFTPFISIIPTPPHETAKNSSGGPFDPVVDKCMKAIQLHSITAKPKRKPGVERTDAYKNWLKQHEYNPYIKHVWLLLGKAHFQNQDYDEAISVFKEIEFLYQTEVDVATEAQLWCMATYIQKGWLYDADILRQIIEKRHLSEQHQYFFNQLYASLLIAQGQYEKAAEVGEKLANVEKNKTQRQRIYFLLGQLFTKLNNPQNALDYFNQIGGLRTSTPLYIESLLAKAKLMPIDEQLQTIKQLRRLATEKRYGAWSSDINLSLASASILRGDTLSARDYLQKVLSTPQEPQNRNKALKVLGDLYFHKNEYANALHYYNQLTLTDSVTSHDMAYRIETLRHLVPHLDIIHREDSLRQLAKLPHHERESIIGKRIRQYRQQQSRNTSQQNDNQTTTATQFDPAISATNESGSQTISFTSYFDNPRQVEEGKAQFRLVWGNRELRDYWRTGGKQTSTVELASASATQQMPITETRTTSPEHEEYYLKDLPLTPEQWKESNASIAEHLLEAAQIAVANTELRPYGLLLYNRVISNYPLSLHAEEALYDLYLIYLSENRLSLAHEIKLRLRNEYAQSEWTKLINEPDFEANMTNYSERQEAVYTAIFKAFKNMEMHTVHDKQAYFVRHFSQSTYLPATTLMDAMAWAYEGNTDKATALWQDIISQYPQTLQAQLAQILLEALGQNRPMVNPTQETEWTDYSVKNKAHQIVEDTLLKADYSPSALLVVFDTKHENGNELLYQVASYNYSNYVLKTFAIKQKRVENMGWIEIRSFDTPTSAQTFSDGLTTYLDSLSISILGVINTTTSVINDIKTAEQLTHLMEGQNLFRIAKDWFDNDSTFVLPQDTEAQSTINETTNTEISSDSTAKDIIKPKSSTSSNTNNRLKELERKAKELLTREEQKQKKEEQARLDKLKKRRSLLKEREELLRQKQRQRKRELNEKRRLREQQLKNRR